MNGHQPKKTCENCMDLYICKYSKAKKENCRRWKACLPPPPHTGSSVQKPYATGGVVPSEKQYITMHIYCDISKEFLQDHNAEIANLTERLENFFRDNEDIKTTIELIARGIKIERNTF